MMSLSSKRMALLAFAALAVTGAAALNWPWLVAAGIAPLLLAMAPCLLMCVFGLCTNHGAKSRPASLTTSNEKSVS